MCIARVDDGKRLGRTGRRLGRGVLFYDFCYFSMGVFEGTGVFLFCGFCGWVGGWYVFLDFSWGQGRRRREKFTWSDVRWVCLVGLLCLMLRSSGWRFGVRGVKSRFMTDLEVWFSEFSSSTWLDVSKIIFLSRVAPQGHLPSFGELTYEKDGTWMKEIRGLHLAKTLGQP